MPKKKNHGDGLGDPVIEDAAKIRKILDEWEASGAIKTSLYYRLLSSITATAKSA